MTGEAWDTADGGAWDTADGGAWDTADGGAWDTAGAVGTHVAAVDIPDERTARAVLSAIVEPGDRVAGALVARLGARGLLGAIAADTLPVREARHYRTRMDAALAGVDIEAAAGRGIRLVCPADPEWPEQLDDLGERRPLALWVRGGDLRMATSRSIAVVGARAASTYGEHVAADLAATVADRGWCVVSGAAYGIDAAAHRGALAVSGTTVAVLACGVDVSYPRRHASLLARVADEGVVVSELPPGATVTKTRFLERNRVIAALTAGTVVVEAAVRSGALNTATHASGLHRHVMAVPGPVTSAMSVGCHRLVRDGQATLVTGGTDVLDLVGVLGDDAAPDERGPARAHDDLALEALRVLEALPTKRGLGLDAIVVRAGLAVPTVLTALAELSDRGLARCGENGTWRLAPVEAGSATAGPGDGSDLDHVTTPPGRRAGGRDAGGAEPIPGLFLPTG